MRQKRKSETLSKHKGFPGTIFAVEASTNRIVRVSSDFLLERSSVFLAA